jgi:hypothetical protein
VEQEHESSGLGDVLGAQPAPALQPFWGGGLTTYDILPAAQASTAEPRRGPTRSTWTVLGVLVVLLALLAGAAVVGLRFLSGGGAQPEDRLPATAFGYARLDLDPSAGQKLDAVRFLRSFPQTKGLVADGSDLRKLFFQATSPAAKQAGLDYDRDVEPWLGSRIGVAVLPPDPGGGTPVLVAALQVRDEGKARTALTKLRATRWGQHAGFVVQGGWAVLAPSDAEARATVEAAARAPLSGSPHYVADLRRLGDPGIVTTWLDADRARAALPSATGSLDSLGGLGGLSAFGSLSQLGAGAGSTAAQGRMAYALRFAGPKVLELSGFATDAQGLAAAKAPARGITTLPATTVAAVGVSGLDASVDALWAQVRTVATTSGAAADFDATVSRLKRQYGITLPADLAVLLGHDTTLALDSTGLSLDSADPPGFGLRAVTDPARGTALAEKAVRASGLRPPYSATVRRTLDGYVVASDAAEAARLAAPGALGKRSDFRAALPDVGAAQLAVWVDVDRLAEAFAPSGEGQALRAIDGIGLTGGVSRGTATFRVRVVIH